MSKKTDEIKVRVEPLSKLALEQIAEEEEVHLSVVARRAFKLYLSNRSANAHQQNPAGVRS